MIWVHWVQVIGTTAMVTAGYCLLARLLRLAPFNRTDPLTWSLIDQVRLRDPLIATHELSNRETGTQSVLRLEMSGVVARLLWPLMRFSARRSLERENAGLKAKCEALATQ